MFEWLKDTRSEHSELKSKIITNNTLINSNELTINRKQNESDIQDRKQENKRDNKQENKRDNIQDDAIIKFCDLLGHCWYVEYKYVKKSPKFKEIICIDPTVNIIKLIADTENIRYFLEYLCEVRTMNKIPKSCCSLFRGARVPFDKSLMYDDNLEERIRKIEETLNTHLLLDFCGKADCKNKVHKGKWCKNHVCLHETCDAYVSPLNKYCELHDNDNWTEDDCDNRAKDEVV